MSEQMKPVTDRWIVAAGMGLVLFIGWTDYVTGPDLSFSIFYLLPIYVVTWFSSARWAGWLAVALSAAVWLVADLAGGRAPSSPSVPYWNGTSRLGVFLVMNYTLLQLKLALGGERSLARSDSLTGILNSRGFYEAAGEEITRSRRYGHQLSLVYFDIDGFKAVNDSEGHSEGDSLLRAVGETTRQRARSSDVAARLGGDEFAVLLPETGAEAAATFARLLREDLAARMEQSRWRVTFSIGVACFLSPPVSVDEMVRRADAAMYRVKSAAKNDVLVVVVGQA